MISRMFSIPQVLLCSDGCFHSNMICVPWFATTNIRLGNDLGQNQGIGIQPKSHFSYTIKIWWILSLLSQSPGVSHAPLQLPAPTMASDTMHLKLWQSSPVVKQTHMLTDQTSEVALIYTFLGKNNTLKCLHEMHENAWQSSHHYGAIWQATTLAFLCISLLTFFPISTNFPSNKATTQQFFSKICL